MANLAVKECDIDTVVFEKPNGERLVTTRHEIEDVLEYNYDNPENPWADESVDEVIEDVKDAADDYLLFYILADMLQDNGGIIESTLSVRE